MALNKDDEWVDVSLLLIPATGNEIAISDLQKTTLRFFRKLLRYPETVIPDLHPFTNCFLLHRLPMNHLPSYCFPMSFLPNCSRTSSF
jgi:hypothetical protein